MPNGYYHEREDRMRKILLGLVLAVFWIFWTPILVLTFMAIMKG